MVMMGNLHEAPLLYLLQRRLKDGRIYTWAAARSAVGSLSRWCDPAAHGGVPPSSPPLQVGGRRPDLAQPVRAHRQPLPGERLPGPSPNTNPDPDHDPNLTHTPHFNPAPEPTPTPTRTSAR